MAEINVAIKGDFKKLDGFFERIKEIPSVGLLNKCGEIGVEALREATPKRTGKTANSWEYRIVRERNRPTAIEWYNTNYSGHECIAILIQYGHAGVNGTFIQGRDYINPAMQTVFDDIANMVIKEVKE